MSNPRKPKYKVLQHLNLGYALAMWQEGAQDWVQISQWYRTKYNFNLYVGTKYNIKI